MNNEGCICRRCAGRFVRPNSRGQIPKYCPGCRGLVRREISQRYCERFPDRVGTAKRKWAAENPEKKYAIDRRHYWNNYKNGSPFQISVTLRNRVRGVLRGEFKSASTLELLGCSLAELRQHLEKNFQPGMTWENYGPSWHIDHIRPCASFDLAEPLQQRECFHYTNLQPLFAQENRKKWAKWTGK